MRCFRTSRSYFSTEKDCQRLTAALLSFFSEKNRKAATMPISKAATPKNNTSIPPAVASLDSAAAVVGNGVAGALELDV